METKEEENYSIILNQPTPSMTHSHLNLPLSMRYLHHHPHSPLLLVAEEAETFDLDHPNDNDKLLLSRATRSLKRRPSLFEKSCDWARRFITLHRIRRSNTADEKIAQSCFELNKKNSSSRKTSTQESLQNYQKSFDEDGYLSPMEIKAKLENISREKQSLPKRPEQQLLIYSHSSSDISQPVYRCHGPVIPSSTPPCTCQQRLLTTSSMSEFHKSISAVDYIDLDISEGSHEDDDPLDCLKYLFATDDKQQTNGNFLRRTPRRSTNTSSISADSGYCDLSVPSSSSSKCIPVHLISCTLIPVNVTRTESMDVRCLTCTCPLSSNYFSNKTERRRQKSSSQSSRTYSRQQMDLIEKDARPRCLCNQKYYSTMAICPTFSVSSSTTKLDANQKDNYYVKQNKQLRKKRTSLLKLSTITDDLTSVTRWYKPHLERDAICQALQSANYGAFILRISTTQRDCYALSVKVPKFSHESNIAHYLIEKLAYDHGSSYRIKGTTKQFPTLLSLLTHHSVMPEILPITLNLNEILPI